MKYLGVDFGLRRVGLAVSDGALASPSRILEGKNLTDLANQVINIFKAEDFEELVVGKPEGKTGQLAGKFIKILEKANLDMVVVDETLSTHKANELMIEMGLSRKKRKFSDAQAAAEILQNYLDSK